MMSDPTATADPPTTEPVVSAADLRAAFDTNVLAAERAYAGKPIRVNGTAGPVKKGADGGYFFAMGDVVCRVAAQGLDVAAEIRPGRCVSATGTLAISAGGAIIALELKGCTLELLPDEPKKDVPKRDKKAVDRYPEQITVRKWDAQGKKFLNPAEVVARKIEKGDNVAFAVHARQSSGTGQAVTGSEMTDASGTVWVVAKGSHAKDEYVSFVKRKP